MRRGGGLAGVGLVFSHPCRKERVKVGAPGLDEIQLGLPLAFRPTCARYFKKSRPFQDSSTI